MVASEGQTLMMLCSALLLFKLLKALLASTNSTALDSLSLRWLVVHELPLHSHCHAQHRAAKSQLHPVHLSAPG